MYETAAIDTRASGRTLLLKKLLWVIIGLLLLISLGQIAFQLFVVPNLTIAHVYVESDVPLAKDEILGIAGIEGNEYYFSLRIEDVQERLEHYPVVRQAVVRKVFPDTVRIVLEGRKPLAIALVEVDKRSVPVCFDDSGVVFHIGQAISEWDLPVVSGLKFGSLRMGMQLPQTLFSFLEDLSRLRNAAPNLFRLISEVRVQPLSGEEYELVIYPVAHNIRVRIGRKLDRELLQYTMLVLDVMERQELSHSVREIDFRTGEVIYRRNDDASKEG